MRIETLPRRLGPARPRVVLVLQEELTVSGTGPVRRLSRAIVGGLT